VIDYQSILHKIQKEVKPMLGKGKVADYIPALAGVSPHKFGMSVHLVTGEQYSTGDAQENFSIQSISKIYTLTMAMALQEETLWKRVGREPSGSKFNSLVQLEYEQGIPRNPFINAGAHVVTDIVLSNYEDPKNEILNFVRKISRNGSIGFNEEIARSERESGNRNLAMGYFMKSYGNIRNKVREVLDVYFHQCSICMTCLDLSTSFLYLANDGILPFSGEAVISGKDSRRINAIMLTCGMYDAVGDFAYRVGLPSKSGVGGGIIAVVPGEMCVAVWSPGLGESGNSLAGGYALEQFVNYTGKSIF
jgi:glutaminase